MKRKTKNIWLGVLIGGMSVAAVGGAAALINKKFNIINPLEKDQKFCAEVTFFGTDTDGIRGGDVVNYKAGINGERNDFDKVPIYKDIVRTYVGGEAIVHVPQFYVSHTTAGTLGEENYSETWGVANYKKDSTYEIPMAFYNAKKGLMDEFTLGAYKASITQDGRKLVSKSGQIPKTNISLEDARPLAEANGAHIAEQRKADAVNILFMVEFATRDCQSVMKGLTYATDLYPANNSDIQVSGETDLLRFTVEEILELGIIDGSEAKVLKYFAPGSTFVVKDDNGEVDEIDRGHIESVTKKIIVDANEDEVEVFELKLDKNFDLDDWSSQGYPCFVMMDDTTGLTDKLKGSSCETKGLDGLRHMNYRGLEDWYGVYYEWVDGRFMKIHNHQHDGTEYSEIVEVFDYKNYKTCNTNDGEHEPTFEGAVVIGQADVSGGIMTAVKVLEDAPGCILPAAKGSNGYSDTVYYNSTNSNSETESFDSRVFYRGGSYYNGSGAGAFCVDRDDSSYYSRCHGFRLTYDN